nr:hypothetical protein [Actinomycetota bacterium]
MRARLPLSLVTAALLLVAVATARGQSAIPRGPGSPPVPESTPTAPEASADVADRNPLLEIFSGITIGALLLLLGVLLLLGTAGLLAMLAGIRLRRPRRPSIPAMPVPDADESPGARVHGFVAAARHARLELSRRAGGPPADAIVAAWLILENAGAERGTPRAAHQTPTEFTGHMSTTHAVDADALTDLRALYH